MSSVLHGIWVLTAVLLLAESLELIPMAVLAAVLVVIGLKLVSIGHMKHLWRHREAGVYAATVFGVIAIGLVEGVLIGLVVALLRALYPLASGVRSGRLRTDGGEWLVKISGSLVFLGAGRLVRELRDLPVRERVVLELHVDFMDHGVFEAIDDWRRGYERLGGEVRVDESYTTAGTTGQWAVARPDTSRRASPSPGGSPHGRTGRTPTSSTRTCPYPGPRPIRCCWVCAPSNAARPRWFADSSPISPKTVNAPSSCSSPARTPGSCRI